MKKKLFGSICLVLGIVIIVSTGTTFAYLLASSTSDIFGDNIYSFDVDLLLDEMYSSSNMIPLYDNKVSEAIQYSNVCRDKDGYEVCSLYKFTLNNSNTSLSYTLNGYLKTTSTTYTTSNLKYQIYDTSYNAISDVMTISLTDSEKVYFTLNNTTVNTIIDGSSVSYYLVIWISDIGKLQTADYSKTFTGVVGFESTSGEILEASLS